MRLHHDLVGSYLVFRYACKTYIIAVLDQGKNNLPEAVYIVGFPKSGNTWLTRLLADCLRAPVLPRGVLDGPEQAAEVNELLGVKPWEAELILTKAHILPQDLVKHANIPVQKVAYVYRDFRAVCVSAFFYWNNVDQDLSALLPIHRLFSLSASEVIGHIKARVQLHRYVLALSRNQIDWFKRWTGPWSAHVATWQSFGAADKNIHFVAISYEKLLENPFSSLCHVVRSLGVPWPGIDRVRQAIERQSFSATRARLQARSNQGTDANHTKLLRKGNAFDWQRYISTSLDRRICADHGTMLRKLHYIE